MTRACDGTCDTCPLDCLVDNTGHAERAECPVERNAPQAPQAPQACQASDDELVDAVLAAIKRLHETPGACLLAWCDAPGTVWVMREERGGRVSALFCERHAAESREAGE